MADPLTAKPINADQPYHDFLLFYLHNFRDLKFSCFFFFTLKVRREKKENCFISLLMFTLITLHI